MTCTKCGHENENGVNFCEECGAPLNTPSALDSFPAKEDADEKRGNGCAKVFFAALIIAAIGIAIAAVLIVKNEEDVSTRERYKNMMKDLEEMSREIAKSEDLKEGGSISSVELSKKESSAENEGTEELIGDWPSSALSSKIPKPWFGEIVGTSEADGTFTATLKNVVRDNYNNYVVRLIGKDYTRLGGTMKYVTDRSDDDDCYIGMNSSGYMAEVNFDEENGTLTISIENIRAKK